MDDQRGRARYDNGNSPDENRRKERVDWDQMLLETGIDQWDVRDRRDMQANLQWVSDHRRTVGARQRMLTLALGIGIPLLGGLASWYGASQGRQQPLCPPGYVCTVIPSPTATP